MSARPDWLEHTSAFIEDVADQDWVAELCHLLSNHRRQYVLLYLLSHTDKQWVKTGEIARWVTAVEEDCPIQNATGQPYHRVRTTLTQTHLKALSNGGVIEYDGNRGRVKTGPRFDVASRVLLLLYLSTTGV